MKRLKLKADKRNILGKKVKKLRRDGVLPANIYGKNIKSVAIQVPYKEFEPVYKEVRETGLIDLEVNGVTQPVLIHNVQTDPLSRKALHTDFYQVNLKEKISTMVPLIIVGEAKAVSDKIGLLLQVLSEVEIEALPEELPDQIEVAVQHLTIVGDQVLVGDLKTKKGVEILTDPSQVIVKISELVSKEAEEQAAQEAAAQEAAKATSEEGKTEEKETKEEVQKTEEKPQETPQPESK